MFERRLYHHIDWALLIAILALCTLGVVMIYSTTSDPTRGASRLFVTQLYAICLGLGAMLVTMTLDYRTFTDKSHLIYGALIGLLLYGLFLIVKEPDLGTAVTLLPVFLAVAYLAGMRMRILGILAVCALLMAPIAWKFVLKDYQKSRISTFIDPTQDAKDAGYQQIQARITVGSGGLTGKGFKQGTQGQLRFLPVAHTDFIFSVLAEEQGFAGVLAALGLYLFVILRTLESARLAKDRLGAYLVLGVLASFTFQVIYNITMSAGLAPVKGLTLPLTSYGGSSMIASLGGFGLILNVRMRRFTN